MMDAPVVATFLEYHPNPTWLADSAGQPVYANQADEHVTEEDRVPFYSVADMQSNHLPYRARPRFDKNNSQRGSAVDVVGAGNIGPDHISWR